MNFRRRLLGVFGFTVILSVAAVTWIAFAITRRAFERADDERTAALVAQFHREFNRRGDEVTHRIETVAGSDAAGRMALAVNQGEPDYGAYLHEAQNAAGAQGLDFLEFVDDQGTIISSAQSPAKFGYREAALPAPPPPKTAFLREETLSDGSALCLCAVHELKIGDQPLYVIGGVRLDKEFLGGLELPAGTRAMLYENVGGEFSAKALIDPSTVTSVDPSTDPSVVTSMRPSETAAQAELLRPLIRQVEQERQEASALIHRSSNAADDEMVQAIPLTGENSQLLGILLVANSRRPYVELRQHIGSAALLAGGAGLTLAVLFSGWAAARVTRPVEQLVEAAREVAGGNWNAYVPVNSADEIGQLADAFNHMTHELLEQKDRLVQSERVAAWRELARRLAHELKNPLFPLQLTVENLVRAREQSPQQFEEIFRESAATLLAEIANLKQIIARFSEFSRRPQPQFQAVQLNEIVCNVMRLFQAQLSSADQPAILCKQELSEPIESATADPDLLHRALSNLVLNAVEAMPQGGTLTVRTLQEDRGLVIEVSDTGSGIKPEDCARLFTPYYTSKPHGTGLGLAIAQSIISDHGGKISVRSQAGSGTTFVIELPRDAQNATSASQTTFSGASGGAES